MKNPTTIAIAALLESNRHAMPRGFEAAASEVLDDLANGGSGRIAITRGHRTGPAAKMVKAIVAELNVLLCTDDLRYAPLRKQAKSISEGSVLAIAGYVSGKIGVSLAAATAGVGFVSLGILRIGVGAFCRINTPKVEK